MNFPKWLKNLLLVVFLIAIIGGSFWVSFLIGKQMLLPSKKLPQKLVPPQIKVDLVEPTLTNISIEVETTAPTISPTTSPKTTPPKPKKAVKKVAATKAPVRKLGHYKVQVGAFSYYSNAQKQVTNLKRKGYSSYISKYGKLWRVLAGSYNSLASANKLVASLKASGFDAVARRR